LLLDFNSRYYFGPETRGSSAGVIYNVIQRGNNKEYIFNWDSAKQLLLREIKNRKASTVLFFTVTCFGATTTTWCFRTATTFATDAK